MQMQVCMPPHLCTNVELSYWLQQLSAYEAESVCGRSPAGHCPQTWTVGWEQLWDPLLSASAPVLFKRWSFLLYLDFTTSDFTILNKVKFSKCK